MALYFRLLVSTTGGSLFRLLATFFRNPMLVARYISRHLHLSDLQITVRLRKFQLRPRRRNLDVKLRIRQDMIRLLGIRTPFTYVDYGAGDGVLTDMFQKSNPWSKGWAIDIPSWHGYRNLRHVPTRGLISKFIAGTETNGHYLPEIQNRSVNVIFIDHVLHHTNLESRIALYRWIHRVISDRGVVIVREHDIQTLGHQAQVEVQHLLFDLSTASLRADSSEYKSKLEWLVEWSRWGLEVVSNDCRIYGDSRTFSQALRPRIVSLQQCCEAKIFGVPDPRLAVYLDSELKLEMRWLQNYGFKRIMQFPKPTPKDVVTSWLITRSWSGRDLVRIIKVWSQTPATQVPMGWIEDYLSPGIYIYTRAPTSN